MVLREYRSGTAFPGVIGRTADVSTPAWPMPNRAQAGAPNVLCIVLDDTGFGQLGCYGSPIATPNLDGLHFSNMHTTVPGRQRHHSVRQWVPLRNAAAARLQHLRRRQVASHPRRADLSRRPLRPLAPWSRL
ncbi:MAG: hypothetical protein ACODUE_02965 [Synechococcus sp.]